MLRRISFRVTGLLRGRYRGWAALGEEVWRIVWRCGVLGVAASGGMGRAWWLVRPRPPAQRSDWSWRTRSCEGGVVSKQQGVSKQMRPPAVLWEVRRQQSRDAVVEARLPLLLLLGRGKGRGKGRDMGRARAKGRGRGSDRLRIGRARGDMQETAARQQQTSHVLPRLD